MGCPCSKLQGQEHNLLQEEDEAGGKDDRFCNYTEALAQCKQRKELLKHAADARSDFGRAHSDYLQALSRTGQALQDFCKIRLWEDQSVHEQQDQQRNREFRHSRSYALEYSPMAPQRVVVPPPNRSASFPSSSSSREQYFDGVLFKPPPPPPGCPSHYWDSDLLQKVQDLRMPRCCSKEAIAGDDDEEDMVLELQGDEVKVTNKRRHESKAPADLHSESANACAAPAASIEDFSSSSCSSSSEDQDQSQKSDLSIIPAVSELSPKELEEIVRYVHQEFIKASQSGLAVRQMLESSNGTELGLLGARVKALTWKSDEDGAAIRDEDSNLGWSQAVTLERLSAWEMKLYEEVKALNSIYADFNKKRKLLCKYGVNRVHDETVDKTRADIKAIETQMFVEIQATEATAAAIQKITNEEMHFQLVELVQGLADMWEKMYECHDHQRNAVLDLKLPRNSSPGGVSSISVECATRNLQTAVMVWHSSLNILLNKEKEYIRSIGEWLKASISKLNKNHHLTRRQARIMHMAIPEIYYLCQEWEKSIENLHRAHRCDAIREFGEAVCKIIWYQMEEVKAHKQVQGLVKELNKKIAAVNNLEKKLMDKGKDLPGHLAEKKGSVEFFRQQVDEEKKKLEELSRASRTFTADSLEKCLPKLFEGVSEFAKLCSVAHQELHTRAKHGIKNEHCEVKHQ